MSFWLRATHLLPFFLSHSAVYLQLRVLGGPLSSPSLCPDGHIFDAQVRTLLWSSIRLKLSPLPVEALPPTYPVVNPQLLTCQQCGLASLVRDLRRVGWYGNPHGQILSIAILLRDLLLLKRVRRPFSNNRPNLYLANRGLRIQCLSCSTRLLPPMQLRLPCVLN